MKLTASMQKGGTAPVKPDWRMFVAEMKKPTTNLTFLLKYGTLAVSLCVFLNQVAYPTWTEYKFYRDEAFAREIFELEQKNKK